jgi:hypothetical protein
MLQRFILLIVFTGCCNAFAQHSKTYSYDSLDAKRVHLNTIGMAHLGAWGAVNVVGGGIGYFTSADREWKSFYGMNVIWGATNALIAYAGYKGASKEADEHRTMDDALHRYESVKRLYLINAGLDVLYIGSGAVINAYADDMNHSAMWHGYAKSFMLQGAVLLLFDGTMYALHSRQDKKWYKLLQGVVVTGNGVGYRYQF